jgi:hypothetical protein
MLATGEKRPVALRHQNRLKSQHSSREMLSRCINVLINLLNEVNARSNGCATNLQQQMNERRTHLINYVKSIAHK